MLITFNKKSSVNEYFFSVLTLMTITYIIGESEDKTIFQIKQKGRKNLLAKTINYIYITNV